MVFLPGYWSDEFRNAKGESLQTCIEQYGWAQDMHPKVFKGAVWVMKNTVIFLDDRRSLEHSWLFSSRMDTDWCHVRCHRDAKVPVIIYDFEALERHATCDYYEE